jgi:hypothetical protein
MNTFKFFQKEEGIRFPPLLHNEQIIHYWDDGDDMDYLTARIIAWSDEWHRWNPQWTFTRFSGTMQEFFTSIQSIPVIKYIERDGTLLYMGDSFPIDCNLQGVYDIYYYKYHEYEDV